MSGTRAASFGVEGSTFRSSDTLPFCLAALPRLAAGAVRKPPGALTASAFSTSIARRRSAITASGVVTSTCRFGYCSWYRDTASLARDAPTTCDSTTTPCSSRTTTAWTPPGSATASSLVCTYPRIAALSASVGASGKASSSSLVLATCTWPPWIVRATLPASCAAASAASAFSAVK